MIGEESVSPKMLCLIYKNNIEATSGGSIEIKILFRLALLKMYKLQGIIAKKVIAFSFDKSANKNETNDASIIRSFIPVFFSLIIFIARINEPNAPINVIISSRPFMLATTSVCTG